MFINTNLLYTFICAVILLISSSSIINAGTYKEITGFGDNPSNIKMFLYTPDAVAQNPPILVACHWCHGKAQDIYNGSRYASVADKFGYYVIFPSANSSDGCWDVASVEALRHNGGGDPLGIVSMVRYVIKNFHADSTRVYALGVSSGAMMTNVLLGAYPDVFAGGAAYASVPFGCFAGPDSWNDDCAKGRITKTPKEWGDLVHAAFPEYSGNRPKIQMWHGTNDEVLAYHNLSEAVKQWTNIHGIDTIPSTTENNVFQSGWTRQRYKNNKNEVVIETIIEQGQPHNLQVLQDEALAFLGLDQPSTDINPGSVHKKSSPSHATVITTSENSSGVTITVRSFPGSASLSLYTINGQLAYSQSAQHSIDGIHTFAINSSEIAQVLHNQSLFIVKVSVNGSYAGFSKLRCFF
ncbi:MAG TPA: PHB depolymerase family esterase [Chitinispirillaceae bacterium]|nr:PHB depolymerase family esterase [Chitinispirillaceae bacterium]